MVGSVNISFTVLELGAPAQGGVASSSVEVGWLSLSHLGERGTELLLEPKLSGVWLTGLLPCDLDISQRPHLLTLSPGVICRLRETHP